MKIEERIGKYLNESGKSKAFDKVMKVIKSCKTIDHLDGALKMIKSYSDQYPNFLSDVIRTFNFEDTSLDPKLKKVFNKRFEEIKLILKNKKID